MPSDGIAIAGLIDYFDADHEWMVTKYKKGDRGLRDLHRRQDSPTNRVTALRVAIRLMAEEVEGEYDSDDAMLDKQKEDLARSRAMRNQLKAVGDRLNEETSVPRYKP